MNLSVKDRLMLINILPKEGDFKTLKSLRKVREALAFTDPEQESLKFVNKDGMITWDEQDKDKPMRREIEITKSIDALIVEALEKLEKTKKLTDELFELYEMFMLDDEEEAKEV